MQGSTPKVVVIGGIYVDIAVRCSQIPSPGQSITGSEFSYAVTGPGPNQAVEAALCDCEVYLISKIGGDPFSQLVKTVLQDYGVNTDFVYTAQARTTGTLVTMVNAEGENASCKCDGANAALLAADIDAAEQIISTADICLIHGQLPEEAILRAIQHAQLHGTKVILNPAKPIQQTERQSSNLPMEYFAVNVLIPNLEEAADITENSLSTISRPDTAKLIGSDLVARGVGAAVITMGRRGTMVVDRQNSTHIPPFKIELVDKTCTGDAFAGALAACYAVKCDIREAVKFASAAGALACTKFGAMESLPTREEIIELLQKEDMQ